jgi:protein SCO1/2
MPSRTTPRLAATVLAMTAALTLTLTGCGTSAPEDGDSTAATTEEKERTPGGVTLDRPFAKPDLTLTDTDGEEYDLVTETRGRATLLYFGYTHCPDVCPLTMSNIAVARSKLTKAQQDALDVVFVTSDPERDTPERLKKWLRMHDASFTGLTGDFDTIQAGARSVGVHIEPSYEEKNGDIVSTHGAQVLAFSPGDDKAHVLWTEDNATAEALERELPKIVEGKPL